MNISWFGSLWAAIKGAFSFGTTAKLSVVDYILDAAYAYYGSIGRVMDNIAKAYNGLVVLCDKLDYYGQYIPAPWSPFCSAIKAALGELRDLLADGKVERVEIERVVEKVRAAIEAWGK